MTHDKTGNELFSATMNPNRGAWLEYETDANDVFYVRIDKNRKMPDHRTLSVRSGSVTRRGDPATSSATMNAIAGHHLREERPPRTRARALLEVYRKLRPGEPPTVDSR